MRINPKEILFDQPILKVREVIRKAMQDRLWGGTKAEIAIKVAEVIKQPKSVAELLIEKLVQEDYLFLTKEKIGTKIHYEIKETEKGSRFGNASASSPISRQKATQLLNELIERAKSINSNDELVYVIESLRVFGSYLSENDALGDLDVGFKLTARLAGEEFTLQNQKRIDLARSNNKSFSSFIDELCWPNKEVMLMLKNNQRGLSLHDVETDQVFNRTESKIVYQYKHSFKDKTIK